MTIHVAKDAPDHEPVLWAYKDATGVRRLGTVEAIVDFGGSDVSYHMRCETGQIHIVSGARVASMERQS
jgi:hypothetical protein